MKPVTASQPILSSVGPTKLTVGNWSLTCLKEGEIAIHNSDGQQATILKEDLPGFVFESNRGTKHSFTAETSLGVSGFPNNNNNKQQHIHINSQNYGKFNILLFEFAPDCWSNSHRSLIYASETAKCTADNELPQIPSCCNKSTVN